MGLKVKTFNILGVHWKIWLLGGSSQKTNIEGGDCLKRKSWTVYRFKGGAWQERRVVFLRGVDTPMLTLNSLQLFPVVWILQKPLGFISYNRWVLMEGHKNYFKDWYLMKLQPIFLFLTYFNSLNYSHIVKRM